MADNLGQKDSGGVGDDQNTYSIHPPDVVRLEQDGRPPSPLSSAPNTPRSITKPDIATKSSSEESTDTDNGGGLKGPPKVSRSPRIPPSMKSPQFSKLPSAVMNSLLPTPTIPITTVSPAKSNSPNRTTLQSPAGNIVRESQSTGKKKNKSSKKGDIPFDEQSGQRSMPAIDFSSTERTLRKLKGESIISAEEQRQRTTEKAADDAPHDEEEENALRRRNILAEMDEMEEERIERKIQIQASKSQDSQDRKNRARLGIPMEITVDTSSIEIVAKQSGGSSTGSPQTSTKQSPARSKKVVRVVTDPNELMASEKDELMPSSPQQQSRIKSTDEVMGPPIPGTQQNNAGSPQRRPKTRDELMATPPRISSKNSSSPTKNKPAPENITEKLDQMERVLDIKANAQTSPGRPSSPLVEDESIAQMQQTVSRELATSPTTTKPALSFNSMLLDAAYFSAAAAEGVATASVHTLSATAEVVESLVLGPPPKKPKSPEEMAAEWKRRKGLAKAQAQEEQEKVVEQVLQYNSSPYSYLTEENFDSKLILTRVSEDSDEKTNVHQNSKIIDDLSGSESENVASTTKTRYVLVGDDSKSGGATSLRLERMKKQAARIDQQKANNKAGNTSTAQQLLSEAKKRAATRSKTSAPVPETAVTKTRIQTPENELRTVEGPETLTRAKIQTSESKAKTLGGPEAVKRTMIQQTIESKPNAVGGQDVDVDGVTEVLGAVNENISQDQTIESKPNALGSPENDDDVDVDGVTEVLGVVNENDSEEQTGQIHTMAERAGDDDSFHTTEEETTPGETFASDDILNSSATLPHRPEEEKKEEGSGKASITKVSQSDDSQLLQEITPDNSLEFPREPTKSESTPVMEASTPFTTPHLAKALAENEICPFEAGSTPHLVKSLDDENGICKGDFFISLVQAKGEDAKKARKGSMQVLNAVWRMRVMRRRCTPHSDSIYSEPKMEPQVPSGPSPDVPMISRSKDPFTQIKSLEDNALHHLQNDEFTEAAMIYREIWHCYTYRLNDSTTQAANVDTKEYLGNVLHNLGIINMLRQDYEAALANFSGAHTHRTTPDGQPNSSNLVTTVKAAMCQYALNNFAKAHKGLETCLEYAKAHCQTITDFVQIAEMSNNLGCLFFMCGRPNNALDMFNESLSVQQAVLSHSLYGGSVMASHSISLSLSITRANLAFLKMCAKDHLGAILGFEASLASQQVLLVDSHETLIGTMDHLAVANLLYGNKEKALKMLERMLWAQMNAYGADNIRCENTKAKIEMVKEKELKIHEAVADISKAHSVKEDISKSKPGDISFDSSAKSPARSSAKSPIKSPARSTTNSPIKSPARSTTNSPKSPADSSANSPTSPTNDSADSPKEPLSLEAASSSSPSSSSGGKKPKMLQRFSSLRKNNAKPWEKQDNRWSTRSAKRSLEANANKNSAKGVDRNNRGNAPDPGGSQSSDGVAEKAMNGSGRNVDAMSQSKNKSLNEGMFEV